MTASAPQTASARPALCVYCGSRSGCDPAYAEAARNVGRLIGEAGWAMVYGGGRAGLMGIVADAALSAGAEVIGVIPESLMERELGHGALTELHVVKSMHDRKRMMAERSDAFIALPGGLGTLEELFEVWTWRQLGYHDKPLGLLNVGGFYDGLLGFIEKADDQGFVSTLQRELLIADADASRLVSTLVSAAQVASGPDQYRLI